jgi:uncharacterized protein (DUF779 family)
MTHDYSGMEPRKNPKQPIFRDHNCGGCNDGEAPMSRGQLQLLLVATSEERLGE